jgi:hypothetical protein
MHTYSLPRIIANVGFRCFSLKTFQPTMTSYTLVWNGAATVQVSQRSKTPRNCVSLGRGKFHQPIPDTFNLFIAFGAYVRFRFSAAARGLVESRLVPLS